ncbi:MAG: hypothetical protein KTR30_26085 [Saprospiraceae bacterium]|nr:hypothetical protein [Saprospiraceae bacterium]
MRLSVWLGFVLLCSPLSGQNFFDIQIPSAEQEAEYIWRTIIDITFFEEYNYQLSLPNGPLIEELKTKSRNKQLSDQDQERLTTFVKTKVYRKEDYAAGYQKIAQKLGLLNKMTRRLKRHQRDWPFKMYQTYPIVLTLYGSGGSYDPDTGRIIVFTTSDGRFKTSDNAAHVVIHEVVHIGIEQSIIQDLEVPHAFKERIVDQLVVAYFKKWLPDYRVQNMGESRIDPFLKNRRDIRQLKAQVAKILS